MKLIVGQLTYANWNTVYVSATAYDDLTGSTEQVNFYVYVDPNAQQSLRIQTENGIVKDFNEQQGTRFGAIGSNDVQFLC